MIIPEIAVFAPYTMILDFGREFNPYYTSVYCAQLFVLLIFFYDKSDLF